MQAGLWGNARTASGWWRLIREHGAVSDFVSTGVSSTGKRYNISLSAKVIELDNEPHLLVHIVNITDREQARIALPPTRALPQHRRQRRRRHLPRRSGNPGVRRIQRGRLPRRGYSARRSSEASAWPTSKAKWGRNPSPAC